MARLPVGKNDDAGAELAEDADEAKRFSRVFSRAPSGKVSAWRQPTPRMRAASSASRARSSAVPRVPASPWVRSRMAVRRPRAAMRSRVPPQVCSTSSRCAAMARTSAQKSVASAGILGWSNAIVTGSGDGRKAHSGFHIPCSVAAATARKRMGHRIDRDGARKESGAAVPRQPIRIDA